MLWRRDIWLEGNTPEGKERVADEDDGGWLVPDGCAPADMLMVGDVPQAHEGEREHEAAERCRREHKCQEEAVVPLQIALNVMKEGFKEGQLIEFDCSGRQFADDRLLESCNLACLPYCSRQCHD